MNIVKAKEYMRGGAMEYGKGGKMPKELLDYFKKKQGKEYQDGGMAPSAYLIPGYENVADEQGMVSGRERMYVAVPGGEGSDPRVLDMQAAMKEFGYDSPMEMARALGVQSSRGDRGFTFEGAQDPAYRRRMLAALGADSMEGLQDRLGIGRVDYERKRDLPNIMRASQGGM